MKNLLYSLPRYKGMFNDSFEYTTKGCKAAKYFLNQLRSHGYQISITFDKVSGYEVVTIANQKLKEAFNL